MLLVIDTSGPVLAVGLFDGARSVAALREEIGRGHAERLLPAIRALLTDAAAGPSDLTGIAVVVGPGSFMGLRVGIATARSMALGLGLDAVGVSRMQALAPERGSAEIVLDARRDHLFVQRFEDGAGTGPLELVPADTRSPDDRAPDLTRIAALSKTHPLPARPIYGRGADAKPQQPAIIGTAMQR